MERSNWRTELFDILSCCLCRAWVLVFCSEASSFLCLRLLRLPDSTWHLFCSYCSFNGCCLRKGACMRAMNRGGGRKEIFFFRTSAVVHEDNVLKAVWGDTLSSELLTPHFGFSSSCPKNNSKVCSSLSSLWRRHLVPGRQPSPHKQRKLSNEPRERREDLSLGKSLGNFRLKRCKDRGNHSYSCSFWVARERRIARWRF